MGKSKFIMLGIISIFISSGISADSSSYPNSRATYDEVESSVGCASNYSKQKKEDIFREKYKNHYMTWTGEVMLPESASVSLNVDRFGTQDLEVSFLDKKAGYDLEEGQIITVRFLMTSVGGCFLPHRGRYATVQ